VNRSLRVSLVLCALLLGMIVSVPALGSEPSSDHAGSSIELTPAETVAENILFVVVDAGIVMLVISFSLCLFRVVYGPTLIDRGIAADTISMQLVGIAILLTITLRTLLYFDSVLIFAILGFATTIAFAQFIGRRRAV